CARDAWGDYYDGGFYFDYW
nr:immunoglobulin heavy chain junction region [Macaca mulatta]MOV48454.1 immunoglobulin heavy chain junction region [Macaca mulatta]